MEENESLGDQHLGEEVSRESSEGKVSKKELKK